MTDVVICKRCGHENDDGLVFCIGCGRLLGSESADEPDSSSDQQPEQDFWTEQDFSFEPQDEAQGEPRHDPMDDFVKQHTERFPEVDTDQSTVSQTAVLSTPEMPQQEPPSSGKQLLFKFGPIFAAGIAAIVLALVVINVIPKPASEQPATNDTSQESANNNDQGSSSSGGGFNAGEIATNSPSNGTSGNTTGGNKPPQTNGSTQGQTSNKPSGSTNSGQANQSSQNSQQGGSSGTSSNGGSAQSGSSNGGSAQSGSSGQNQSSENQGGTAHAGKVDQDSQMGTEVNSNSGNSSTKPNDSSQTQNKPSSTSENTTDENKTTNKTDEYKLVAKSDEASATPTTEFKGMSGNIANLVNGGQLASYDKYIYYAKPEEGKGWVTKSIVRAQADSAKTDVIYEGPSDTESINNISAVKNRLVFVQSGKSKSYVISTNMDGEDIRAIDECDAGSLCEINDGYVYYQRDGVVYRCDPYGKGNGKMYEAGESEWCIGDNMIFIIEDSAKISFRLFGVTNDNKMYEASSGYSIAMAFNNTGNGLVVLEKSKSGNDWKLVTTNTQGNTQEIWKGTDEVVGVNIHDSGYIITKKLSDDSYVITSYVPSTKKENTILELKNLKGEVRYPSYLPYYVAYANVSDGSDSSSWNIVTLDGSKPHVI